MRRINTKEDFIKIYNEHIMRSGSDALLDWLSKNDFFTAPASTRFHNAFEGGLCDHSVNVYHRLRELAPESPAESVAICGLLHDICKANFYKVEMRNAKNENGVWVKVPYYAVDDKLPYGHGEKSVYIISGFMTLSREEAMAIRWPHGRIR